MLGAILGLTWIATMSLDTGPSSLALISMVGGYAVSGRGLFRARVPAGILDRAGIVVFLALNQTPDRGNPTQPTSVPVEVT